MRTLLLFPMIAFALWMALATGGAPVHAEDESPQPANRAQALPPRGIEAGGPEYVGSDGCVRCHEGEHGAWLGSSHATTFVPATAEHVPPEVVAGERVEHDPGFSHFHGEDGRFIVETIGDSGKPERFDFTHVVGRMRVRMYVATLPDGRMQVMPSMLEEPTGEWFDYTHLLFGGEGSDPEVPPVVRPGDGSFWTGPVRAWDAKCARCHTSGRQMLEPQEGQLGTRSTERALGVDCEMCHGPGKPHVAYHDARAAGHPHEGPDPILDYASLARDRQVSLCLRCHMESDIEDPSFQHGDDIFEHVTPTLLLSPDRIDAYGRVLELIYDGVPFSVSRCATEGQMTCVTCHDPHGSGERSQLKMRADNDRMCTQCHEDIAADPQAHTHHPISSEGARCIGCHMPFLAIERGHGVVADHSISIPRLDLPGDRVAQDACSWCHQDGLAAPESPKLDDAALREAYRTWWPDPTPPPRWAQLLAQARLQKGDAGVDVIRGLVEVAEDEAVPRVVRASATALLETHAKQMPLSLLFLAQDEDSLVRRTAVRSLASLPGRAVDLALRAAMEDPSMAVRHAAAKASLVGWTRVEKNRALLIEAEKVLTQAAAWVPEDEARWFDLGSARQLLGDLPGAVEAYERYTALDPTASAVRDHLEKLRARIR